MTLAIVLVVFAVLALLVIARVTVSGSLQISSGRKLARQIEPVDVEAFRNLVDPAEDAYLRRRLTASQYRLVQRERLRAVAAYIRVAAHNAAVLITLGQAALAASDSQTVEAARQLIDNALLLRRNATFALLKIYAALAWPQLGLSASPVLQGYERLNGSAMLLGRLQNPAAPVRISSF
ncbi:MAG TPA: hypothetical protein VGS27_12375 [Candidatus Sulfotelmatobacter sp.]|nr:hypothetical protein [Candidatus Sulfotelmatobacter sp.]